LRPAFGSRFDRHLHFHCLAIESVFESVAAGDAIFRATTGLDTNAIARALKTIQHAITHRVQKAQHSWPGIGVKRPLEFGG
jgi:hypothetical protein